jgi:predicted MFS family arabinose efflux permease
MGTITDTEESSAQGRILAWKQGIQMALGSPLIGVGPGHFPMAYGTANTSRWMTAHSIYFLLLGELGFPGLTLLLILIFSNLLANRQLLQQVWRLPRDDAATARNILACTSAATVGFAVGGAFLSAAYYPHLYVLSGVLVAGRHIVRVQLEAHEHAGQSKPVDLGPAVARPPVRPGAISTDWKPRPALGTSDLGRNSA